MRKLNWKKILTLGLWLLAGAGLFVLLGAAIQKKDQKQCSDIRIEITGVSRHLFIDEKDVLEIMNSRGQVKGMPVSSINLRALEEKVEKDPWVYRAEMFIDNNQVLEVRIEERQPVARVFTRQGNSFYLDSNGMRLPLSEKLSARVPVFTGFPSDKLKLAKPDSALLLDIVKLGQYVGADSFWMAQVAQIDILPGGGFEITPVIGDQAVVFGSAEDIAPKFKKLYTFYQKAWLQNGMNTYEKLDIQYNNQVVAIKRGTAKAQVDSAKARQLLAGMMVANARSFDDSSTTGVPKPVVITKADSAAKHPAAVPVLPVVTKPFVKTKSVAPKNNKTGAKPLTNGAKQKQTTTTKHKPPPPKKTHPKAVMEKTKN